MPNSLPVPSPTVICKELDEGAVLFCSRTEVYFGLNPVGVLIWNALAAGAGTLDALVNAMEAHYPEQNSDELRADARGFVEALVESELLVAPTVDRADP